MAKKELLYNPKTGSFDKVSKTKSKEDGEYNPETGSFEKESKIKKIKKTASKPKRTEKLKKKSKNLKKKSKIKKVKKTTSKPRRTEKLKTRKSKKGNWSDSYNPETGSFENELSETVKSKKSEQRKILHVYGYEYFEDEFLKGAQETINHLVEHFKKAGITLKYPLATTGKGKYWDSRNIYPTSKSDFIEKFFKKRKPVGIEGIWENKLIGIDGVVKEGSHYQMYTIECWHKDKAPPNFFDKLLYGTHEIDYNITSGTKSGALFPTSDNAIFKFEGVSPIIFSPEENQVNPANLLVSADAIINEKGNLYLALFPPPTPGSEYHRIWPNKPVVVEEKIEDSKKSGLSSGTGFFVDHSGHIITNYHVVEPCNNKTKIVYKDTEYKTKLIAKDKNLDLALLKANVKNNFCIKTFDKPIKKLQSIVAAGYPLSNHLGDDLKFTSGIISSLKGFDDDTTQIQIDAALNLGNSGGPIIDKRNGELVAVAVAIHARRDIVEGINFGIKVSQVKDFLYANGIETKQKKLKNKSKNVTTILENSTLQILCQ